MTVVTEKKAFYKSTTFWIAIVTIVIGASEQLNLLADFLPDEYKGIYLSATGVLMLIARQASTVLALNASKQETDTE